MHLLNNEHLSKEVFLAGIFFFFLWVPYIFIPKTICWGKFSGYKAREMVFVWLSQNRPTGPIQSESYYVRLFVCSWRLKTPSSWGQGNNGDK